MSRDEIRGFSVVSALALAAGAAFPDAARADWQAVVLHPEWGYTSEVYAAGGSRQGGIVRQPDGYFRPILWDRSPDNYVDLLPAGSPAGWIAGMDATRQVGVAYVNSVEHAALWSGTPDSWVDLHPAGAYSGSKAFAVAGNQQVGWASRPGGQHAALWHGTAESFVDLHPSVAL